MEVKKQYPKRVPVSDRTHKKLSVLKAEHEDGSFDETINFIIDEWKYVQRMEKRIIHLESEIRKLGGIP